MKITYQYTLKEAIAKLEELLVFRYHPEEDVKVFIRTSKKELEIFNEDH